MASSHQKDINLLLIGKTGNGKSALGNSILRTVLFVSTSSTTSVTTSIAEAHTDFNGRRINVVDGPGVGDTRVDNELATVLVLEAMNEAIRSSPNGYNALLLVVRFGRFSNEDKDTVDFLKKLFGVESVKQNCILVITHGDDFESEESGEGFEEWCAAQQGVFQELLQECHHRAVLFNNKTKDKSTQDRQLKALIEMVDQLDNVYTDEHFSKAIPGRIHLMIEARRPIISFETSFEIQKITEKLERLHFNGNPANRTKNLDEIFMEALELQDLLDAQDAQTGLLENEKTEVKILLNEITSKYTL
ncbi:GTPase IMAP family member 7-like [Biomphalaria glabrata]|uniref:GTPase IMAP family member 7-like n=1 Tax=Biomphalaria glabrata TaxID=6526 RepID=A0A9U8EBM5_BIOGL|nr:GTPase IMAP family member 7-like [Biomphalaria glabrata]XP_055869645.1 GTPase IMAP family member 7-like [Biomphalaria glabrata]